MSDGYLGPDSVAWRIHADPSGLVSGIRSLMVQALSPRAMAGVAEHSDFREDFWGRLRRTADYLQTVVFGTKEEADRISAIVRRVHEHVKGVDEFTGKSYSAEDPELLSWVHHATVESYLRGYRLYGKHLTQPDADRYVDEMRVLGRLMLLPDDLLAGSEEELREYMRSQEPELAASPAAREGVRTLLNPGLPLKIAPLWTLPAVAAFASLPASYRRMYGLNWLGGVGIGVRVPTSVLITGFRLLLPPPPAVRAARSRAGQAA